MYRDARQSASLDIDDFLCRQMSRSHVLNCQYVAGSAQVTTTEATMPASQSFSSSTLFLFVTRNEIAGQEKTGTPEGQVSVCRNMLSLLFLLSHAPKVFVVSHVCVCPYIQPEENILNKSSEKKGGTGVPLCGNVRNASK